MARNTALPHRGMKELHDVAAGVPVQLGEPISSPSPDPEATCACSRHLENWHLHACRKEAVFCRRGRSRVATVYFWPMQLIPAVPRHINHFRECPSGPFRQIWLWKRSCLNLPAADSPFSKLEERLHHTVPFVGETSGQA